MKKVFFILVLFFAVGVNAQIVTSRSWVEEKAKPAKKNSTSWYLRGGFNIMSLVPADNAAGKDYYGSKLGYDLSLGFQKPMGSSGLYWGMEWGATSCGGEYGVHRLVVNRRGYSNYYEESDRKASLFCNAVRFIPFTLGFKKAVVSDFAIDVHTSLFASYNYTLGKLEREIRDYHYSNSYRKDKLHIGDAKPGDVGVQLGIGVWWKNFNLDFTYQRGFVHENYIQNMSHSNFMIRLGGGF